MGYAKPAVRALTLVLLGIVGCGKAKLDMESLFEVPVEGKSFKVDPIKSEQNIQVTGTATQAPVNVYVYLDKNEAAVEKEIMTLKTTANVLAKQEKTEAISLTATIPANETAVVRVTRGGGKAARVQLKITNR